MSKLKWGVIGCSNFAWRRSIPAMLAASNVELLGIASRSREKAEKFATEFGVSRVFASYDELLEDDEIEAVHIPLPNSMHVEWTERALERGKHVLSEKPFAARTVDLYGVRRLAENTGLKVMEAFMWRYHPQHRKARQLIDSGVIGEPAMMRAAFTYVREDKPDIRLDRTLGGGSLLDVGCYPVSCARFYFGAEPLKVFARASFHPRHEVDMSVSCLLEFEKGVAHIDCGFHLPYRTDVEIVGERGRIYMPRAWQPFERSSMLLDEETIELPACNHYVLMFEGFSECVLSQQPLEWGLDDACRQARTLEAIRESMTTGMPVVLEPEAVKQS